MADEFDPKIVGFFCNWCTYPGVDQAGLNNLDMPASVAPIRVMCSGRVSPVLIMNALLRGADGVIVTGCHLGECHYDEGNYYGRRRFAYTKTLLDSLGLEGDRLKLGWFSAHESRDMTNMINEFIDKIKELGPNPIRERSSL